MINQSKKEYAYTMLDVDGSVMRIVAKMKQQRRNQGCCINH